MPFSRKDEFQEGTDKKLHGNIAQRFTQLTKTAKVQFIMPRQFWLAYSSKGRIWMFLHAHGFWRISQIYFLYVIIVATQKIDL